MEHKILVSCSTVNSIRLINCTMRTSPCKLSKRVRRDNINVLMTKTAFYSRQRRPIFRALRVRDNRWEVHGVYHTPASTHEHNHQDNHLSTRCDEYRLRLRILYT